MSTLGERALAAAIGEIGVREDPPRSNTGPRIREYQKATWLSGTGWPWCAAFVNWCYRESGYILPDRSAGAWDLVDRAVRNGWGVEVPVARAEPGDMVAFRFGSGHIALFESYDRAKAWVTTIDGNSQDQVIRQTRHSNTLYRIVHVKAGGELPAPVPPGKTPVYQVVTSASGTKQVVFSGTRAQAVNYTIKRLRGLLPWKKGSSLVIRRKP